MEFETWMGVEWGSEAVWNLRVGAFGEEEQAREAALEAWAEGSAGERTLAMVFLACPREEGEAVLSARGKALRREDLEEEIGRRRASKEAAWLGEAAPEAPAARAARRGI